MKPGCSTPRDPRHDPRAGDVLARGDVTQLNVPGVVSGHVVVFRYVSDRDGDQVAFSEGSNDIVNDSCMFERLSDWRSWASGPEVQVVRRGDE
jgi:hypothetical protein